MHKILIAPDSFKHSLTAAQVAGILADAAARAFPDCEIIRMPVSDGGEGLVDALLGPGTGRRVPVRVHDPLGREIDSYYGLLPDGGAVIEMAAASGLPLLKANERDVMKASTRGTGELIAHALAHGCRDFILGLGGSATNDGGAGAASALGIRYLGRDGQVIESGSDLEAIERIDRSALLPGLAESRFTLACDVTNPLYGEAGAAYVFSPQKGASPAQVEKLDRGLQALANRIHADGGPDLQAIPGSGAAGGLGVPFLAFLGASLKRGLDIVLDARGFDHELEGYDLVVTGEGRCDRQSSMGKVLSGIGQRASAKGVPVIAICGSLGEDAESVYELGITALFSTCREVSDLETALRNAAVNLTRTAEDVFNTLKLGGV